MSWRHDAACRGMDVDLFFPMSKDARAVGPGLAVCAVCPVSDECLLENIHEPFGVFGGTTPQERQALRRRLGLRVAQPEARHGTDSRYSHHKCRCEPCMHAHRLAQATRRERAGWRDCA